jgi:hypothetical protein
MNIGWLLFIAIEAIGIVCFVVHSLSNCFLASSDVPQGFCLSPIWFSLFTNNLNHVS